jgi:hypothetical protein
MGCHESLMARRRKKSKAATAARSREKENSPMVVEKSLPALPPSAIPPNAFSNTRVDPDSDTPTELSPRPRTTHRHNESSSRGSSKPARSPERPDSNSKNEGLSLPATTYRKNRNSAIYQSPDSGPGEGPESFFIPVALDPSPAPSGTPRSMSDNANDGARRKDRDYFSAPKGSGPDKRDDSQSSTPHIAFQEKSRQPSSDLDVGRLKSGKFAKSSGQDQRKASVSGDEFKLQEAPATKKGLSTRSNSSHSSVPHDGAPGKASNGVVRKDGHTNLSEARKANEPRTSEDTDGTRGGVRSEPNKAIARKEVPSAAKSGMYLENVLLLNSTLLTSMSP